MDEFHHPNTSFPPQSIEFHQTKHTGLFQMISLRHLPAKAWQKVKKPIQNLELMGISQKGRQRPQKRKDSRLVGILGTSTYATGVTNLGTL